MHRSKQRHYSITSSARARSVGGTSRPSALAVLRLTRRSCLFDHLVCTCEHKCPLCTITGRKFWAL